MNFSEFDFDNNTKAAIASLENSDKIPHAILIESADKEKSLEAARYLSAFLVCDNDNKPCGKCGGCHKALNNIHPDISYARAEKKSQIYSIEQMRDIGEDAYILPNEAKSKVYILADADERLSVIAQNSFLKLLEEPPENVYFIMTCTSSVRLLVTILSRCTVIRLSSKQEFDKETFDSAVSIVNGILSPREYELLKAIEVLSDKEKADEILTAVSLALRDGFAVQAGAKANFDEELGRKLSLRFTKDKLIKMLELTALAKKKTTQNVNFSLLTTWLCGEYRRISWQR